MQDRLTVAEAAALLGVAPFTVRRLITNGHLKAERFGKAYSIRRADLKRIDWPATGRPPKVTSARVRQLHGEGHSDNEIARRLGVAQSTISRRRVALGLPAHGS